MYILKLYPQFSILIQNEVKYGALGVVEEILFPDGDISRSELPAESHDLLHHPLPGLLPLPHKPVGSKHPLSLNKEVFCSKYYE